jgi:hypothetical protein
VGSELGLGDVAAGASIRARARAGLGLGPDVIFRFWAGRFFVAAMVLDRLREALECFLAACFFG